MKTKERVKELIDYLKITQTSFEKSIQVSNGYVNSIKGSIGPSVLNRILEKYPNISRDWIMYGEGEMLTGGIQHIGKKDKTSKLYLEKGGIKIYLEEITYFIAKNQDEALKDRLLSNIIEEKVSKKIAEIMSSKENFENWLKRE